MEEAEVESSLKELESSNQKIFCWENIRGLCSGGPVTVAFLPFFPGEGWKGQLTEGERNAVSSAFIAGGQRLKEQIEPFPATGSQRIKKLALLTEVTGLETMQTVVIFTRGPSQKPRSQEGRAKKQQGQSLRLGISSNCE